MRDASTPCPLCGAAMEQCDYSPLYGYSWIHPKAETTAICEHSGKLVFSGNDPIQGGTMTETQLKPCPIGPQESNPPDFRVGDWVEFRDIEGIKHGIIEGIREEYSVLCNGISQSVGYKFIIRKLDPSEVVIHIGCMSGTVRPVSTNGIHIWFHLIDADDKIIATIRIKSLDAPTRELVESLLKAQEEQ